MSGQRNWTRRLLLLSVIGALGTGSPVGGLAATRCQGTYFSPTSLVTGASTGETIDVRPGAVSLSSCGAGRVLDRPASTKLTAIFRSCPNVPGRARLAVQFDASCTTLQGVFRARRSGIQTSFTASLGGSVTGRIIVPDRAQGDVDTADPAMDGDNESFVTAQPLALSGTVGGAAGADDGTVDRGPHRLSDFYRLSLDGSAHSVTLAIADPAAADLDLFLLDAAGKDLVPPATGPGNRHAVTIPATTGTAFLVVATHLPTSRSASSYVLSFAPAAAAISANAEFVPGEMIVRLREWSPQAGAGRFSVAGTEATAVAGDPTARSGCLYRLGPSAQIGAAAAGDPWQATVDAVAAMRARPDVIWAQPNYLRKPSRLPNDPFLDLQWHYPLISLPEAWDVTIGSPDVVVAVIDTGLLIGHPDIAAERLVPGFDFISNQASAQDGDGIDDDPFDVGDGAQGAPSSFHGTHVAGTIGAATDNGIGVAGVDWNAKIMPLRVLGAGGGSDFDIAQAIRFAAGLPNVSGTEPAARADVINMSLGGPGESPAMHEAVRDARAAGVIVVVAAGNENADAAGSSPASFPEVVCVSAVDLQGARAFYSNFGAAVDVTAPGGDTRIDRNGDGFADGVLSTRGDDSDGQAIRPVFTFFQGTSMASPHVAGVVALMQAAFMDVHAGARMTPAQFDALLASGVLTDPIDQGNFSGHGLINARKAVVAAAEPVAAGEEPVDGDVGHVFVRLLDLDSGATVAESDSDATRGYQLRLQGPIPPGRYTITAGTDRDGDGDIDDTGEAFGDRLVEVPAAGVTTIDVPVLERIGS